MQRHLDSGEIQVAVTAVARRGEVVHFSAHGLMEVERGQAMQEDAIFRMASSSKPALGVAPMVMIKEPLLHPSDEVGTYLHGSATCRLPWSRSPQTGISAPCS